MSICLEVLRCVSLVQGYLGALCCVFGGDFLGECSIFQCLSKHRDKLFISMDVVIEVVSVQSGVMGEMNIWL